MLYSPEVPTEVRDEVIVIKDWEPRAEVLVEGSIFTVSYMKFYNSLIDSL